VTVGIVAGGKTAQEASEYGSGHRRLGACDCKAVREERCAVEKGPLVPQASYLGRFVGPASKRPAEGIPEPRITKIINDMCMWTST
jgi:hypothetical protein